MRRKREWKVAVEGQKSDDGDYGLWRRALNAVMFPVRSTMEA